MTMRLLFLLLFWRLFIGSISSQSSTLFGKVTEAETGEAILFGSVVLYQDDIFKSSTETDLDGNYNFINVKVGVYTLQASYLGRQTTEVVNITVPPGKRLRANVVLKKQINDGLEPSIVIYQPDLVEETDSSTLAPVVIRAYRVPLVDSDYLFAGGGSEIQGRTSRVFASQSVWPNLLISDKVFLPSYLGSLTGTVRDVVGGKHYSDIEIILKKNGTKIRSATTDLLGVYHFSNLVPGRYELVVPSTNATPVVSSIIEITGGQKLDKTMILEEQQGQ